MQALKLSGLGYPFGHVFHWHEDDTDYRVADLSQWTNRELILKHYHLTARLDGYNHLTATENMKRNALIFRDELTKRGVDGARHCMEMDRMYDAGHRWVVAFYPKTLDTSVVS